MDLTGTKAVVLVLLGLIKLFSGIAPLLFTRILKRRNDKFLKKFIGVVLCFGGGILLSTVLLHMLGEVRESLERATELGMIPQTMEYPFAELLVGMGFLLILLIESVVHKFFGGQGHSHFPSQETLAKTIVTSENVTGGVENSGYVVEVGQTGGERERSQSTKCDVYNVSDPAYRSYSSDSDSSSMEAASKTEIQRTRSEKKILASLRSFLVVVALSIHSLFEGMAIGLEETDAGVWKLLLAVSIHAVPIVFCMGTDMISSGVKKMRIIVYMIILSINTPIGILIGILVTAHMENASGQHILVIGVLQGLAAGTLLYITFFEVLARDKLTKYGMSGLLGALAVMAGFTLMAGMESTGGHSHGHGHGHHHAEGGLHAGHVGHAGHHDGINQLELAVTDPEHSHKYHHHQDEGEDLDEADHEDHKHHYHDEEDHQHDHPDHQHHTDEPHHNEEDHDDHHHHHHHSDELHHDEEDHDVHEHEHHDEDQHGHDEEDHDDHEHEHHEHDQDIHDEEDHDHDEHEHHDKEEDQHNIETGTKSEEYFEYNVTDYKFMHDNVAYD